MGEISKTRVEIANEAKARAEKSSAGPLLTGGERDEFDRYTTYFRSAAGDSLTQSIDNTRFVKNAREDVIRLANEVLAMDAEITQLRTELEKAYNALDSL